MAERKNLELSVRDFGPIAKADIDLRPMTVFVGPSNTGKSYLAILIYALHNFFDRFSRVPFASSRGGSWGHREVPDEDTAESIVSELIEWILNIDTESESTGGSPGIHPIAVPSSIGKVIASLLTEMGGFDRVLTRELARCFGIEDATRLIRHQSRIGASVWVKRQMQTGIDSSDSFDHKLTVKGRRTEFAASIPENATMFVDVSNEEITSLKEHAQYLNYFSSVEDTRSEGLSLLHSLAESVDSYIRHPLSEPAHYLPADRTGVMHAHRVAVGALIQRAPYAGIQREETLPVLSGVLADFLRQLGELDVHRRRPWMARRHRGNAELAVQIERNMLNGSVRFENSVTGYPIFSYRPQGWREDIPLMNTSSMVSELAPVVLYLRHVVQPGETLIIEEPESHLHPAMQVEFTRQLAAVVHAGVRVIVTTHSEWVLDELANLVKVSGLPKSRRGGIGGADYPLKPDQLGVWLFEPKNRPRGSVVKEIPFDDDFGGFRSGFDEVAMGTYNDYAAISNRMVRSRS